MLWGLNRAQRLPCLPCGDISPAEHLSCRDTSPHDNLSHEKFLHMTDFFSTSTAGGAGDKYQVWISLVLQCRSTLVVLPLCVVSPSSRKTSRPMYMFWQITSKYGSNHGRRSFLLCLVWTGFGEVQLVGGGTSRHGGHKVVVRWRTATDNK